MPYAIAQIDEDQPSHVAYAMDPSEQDDIGVDIGGGQARRRCGCERECPGVQ